MAMPRTLRRSSVWIAFALFLALAPRLFTSNQALSMLSQMGYLIIICLSYNMLLGQGGMLSFCHAIFAGTGGYALVYLVNLGPPLGLTVPLAATPVFGGLAAALLAVPLGYLCTRRGGITFAMITLGIGEMVLALAVMLPGLSGGDAGIAIDRVYGKPPFGITFGPQIQVYYLVAAYCFACTALMYAFGGTPLGRMLLAVRDNPERAEFVGYNTRTVRWLAFIASSFFAGVGGALTAINFEIVNAVDVLGLPASGSYLLFTFLGGTMVFYGPIIGAVLMVLALVLLAGITSAWPLYLGLLFLLMVMWAPGGVAGLVAANLRLARSGSLHRVAPVYAALIAAAGVLVLGAAALVEMSYHHQLDAGLGPQMNFLGVRLDTSRTSAWLGATILAAVGALATIAAWRRFAVTWERALAGATSQEPGT